MHKEPSHNECLPAYTGPLRFAAYRYPRYEVSGNTLFGLPRDRQLEPADWVNVHDRFHELYPRYEGHMYASKHFLRETVHSWTASNKTLMHTIENGVELVNDVLSAYDEAAPDGSFAEAAVRLCEKYGLLTHQPSVRVEEELSAEWREELYEWHSNAEVTPGKSPHDHLWFSFSLGSLMRFLVRMRVLYLCWRVLYWDVNETARQELDALLDRHSLMFGVRKLRQNPPSPPSDRDIEIVKQVFAEAGIDKSAYILPGETGYPEYSPHDRLAYDEGDYYAVVEAFSQGWTPSIVLEFTDGFPVRMHQYETVMDAATGCMLDIISMGLDGLEQRTMETCARCGAPFIKEHGRQRYCAKCGSNTVRVREHRARKAKEAQHEKKGKQ